MMRRERTDRALLSACWNAALLLGADALASNLPPSIIPPTSASLPAPSQAAARSSTASRTAVHCLRAPLTCAFSINAATPPPTRSARVSLHSIPSPRSPTFPTTPTAPCLWQPPSRTHCLANRYAVLVACIRRRHRHVANRRRASC